MSRKFLTALDLAQNELQNAAVQNLASAPSSPVKGQLYFNSTGGNNTLYWWDGTVWVPAKASSSVPLSNSASSLVPGNAAAGGASTDASRGDHVHGLPAFGASTAQTTFGLAKTDGAAGTFARSDHAHGTPTHDAAAHSTIPINALATATGPVNMGGFKITNLADPTAANDATSKQYVDNAIGGLSWKDPVRAATTANITLSGQQTIDGVAIVQGDRVLVRNQTTPSANGIYVANAGGWARATDADQAADLEGAAVFVSEGTTLGNTAWVMTADSPITIGTTNITWSQFMGAGQFIAGAGLTLTGNTFDVVAADGSIVVAADSIRAGYTGSGTAVTLARSDHTHDGVVGSPDPNYYVRSYTTGCAAGLTTVVPHNWGTRQIICNVYRTLAPFDTVETDVERTDGNNVTIRFAQAVGVGDYTITLMGVKAA